MKINNRKELYKYLDSVNLEEKRITPISSVYFMVTYNGKTEPIYFMSYDGAYFESDCSLSSYDLPKEQLSEHVSDLYEEKSFNQSLEYEKTMQRGDIHYDIVNFQCSPFLPEKLDNIEMVSELECLDWLIKHK